MLTQPAVIESSTNQDRQTTTANRRGKRGVCLPTGVTPGHTPLDFATHDGATNVAHDDVLLSYEVKVVVSSPLPYSDLCVDHVVILLSF